MNEGFTPQELRTIRALNSVHNERVRQERLCSAGKFPWTCAALDVPDTHKLAPLGEEFGEVCEAQTEILIGKFPNKFGDERQNLEHLREELTHLAAVSVAWIEALNQILEAKR